MGLLHASKSGFFPWCLNLDESPDTTNSNLGLFISLEKAMELYWKSKSIILAASGTITVVQPDGEIDGVPQTIKAVETWSGSGESVSEQSYLDRICGTAIFPSVTSYSTTYSYSYNDDPPSFVLGPYSAPFEGINFGDDSAVVTNTRNSSNNIFAWPFGKIPYFPGYPGFDLLGATNIASFPNIKLSSSAQVNFQYCGIYNFFGLVIPLYVDARVTGYLNPYRIVTGSLNVSISVGQTYDFS